MRHSVKDIVNGTNAHLLHIHNGVASYIIDVKGTIYQWDIYISNPKYYDHYFAPDFRPVEVIKWLRDDIDTPRFIQLN